MRKLSFIISLLGILILLLIPILIRPALLLAPSDLNKTIDNQKVLVSGKVLDEKIYASYKILKLNNGISLNCNCKSSPLKNKNISALGIINEFPIGNKQIEVLKIKIDR